MMRHNLLSPLRTCIHAVRDRMGRRVYSQEGEDLILDRYFHLKNDGFFVDVGAHHPYRFSNTYLLYKKGWRGVNIDAMPGSMIKFRRARPRDVSIEAAIGSVPSVATYFMFNEPALNTFDPMLAEQRQVEPYRLVGKVSLPVRPLSQVLEEIISPSQQIDLLTVDVEGRDLDVLVSNDWVRFRPKMVLAETLGRSYSELRADPLIDFLSSVGYGVAAKTFNTTFLMEVGS